MPTINFNGKTYNDINEMPANERQAFEQMSQLFVDKNGNGIPDFLEGDLAQNVTTAYTSSFVVNGKTYNNLDELPADMHNKVRSAFDVMAKMGLVTDTTSTSASEIKGVRVESKQPAVSKPFLSEQPSSVIEEDRGTNTFTLVLGGIVLCFALIAVTIAVLYFTGR